jgi:hypothetical protein
MGSFLALLVLRANIGYKVEKSSLTPIPRASTIQDCTLGPIEVHDVQAAYGLCWCRSCTVKSFRQCDLVRRAKLRSEVRGWEDG